MKNFFEWLKRNISTLFSILGILATIYFSLFYVPDYLKEAKLEKVRNVNINLIETVQESLYNDQDFQIADIESLIRGKELKYNVTYPYSVDELLVQVQEGFYGNKFIPLEKRKFLSERITALRAQAKSTVTLPTESQKSEFWRNAPPFALAAVGIIISLFGLYSVYFKAKKEKEIEIEQGVNLKTEQIEESVKSGFEYERLVGEALKELNLKCRQESVTASRGYDFLVEGEKSKFIIEAKYSIRSNLHPSFVSPFLISASLFSGDAILVSNVPLSKSSLALVEKLNTVNKNKIYIVIADSKDEIKSKLKELIDSHESS